MELSWEEAVARYIEAQRPCRKPRTLRSFQYYLGYFRKEMPGVELHCLQSQHLRQYLQKLAQSGLKSWQRRLLDLLPFFRWATDHHYLAIDPTAGVEIPRGKRNRERKRTLSQGEVANLLSFPVKTWIDHRDQAVLEFLYGTGLRSQEAIDVQLDDVDLRRCQVQVRKGKGGTSRCVPFLSSLAAILTGYVEDIRGRQPQERALWLNFRGQPLTYRSLAEIVRKRARRAGLPPTSPHDLRHAYATHLLEEGASLRHIQLLLGHRLVSSTQLYTQLLPQTLLRTYRRTHPRARKYRRG